MLSIPVVGDTTSWHKRGPRPGDRERRADQVHRRSLRSDRQQITKYYFAGTQRIAMRKYTIPSSMSVEYLLGDHLGSTGITTDNTGAKVSEMRYNPWGEARSHWTSSPSTTPTYSLADYTFTGQYSYMDDPSTTGTTEGFGLMFYNARMYDPALGRFTSADSIVPAGVQGYDRYAYVNNNPVKYIDPTGHMKGDPCYGAENGYKCNRDRAKAAQQTENDFTQGLLDFFGCQQSSGPRYCEMNNGAVIDRKHFNITQAKVLWDSLQEAFETGKNVTFPLIQTWSGASTDFTALYTIYGSSLQGLEDQLAGIGVTIWLDFQVKFESWQAQEKDWWEPGSSFHAEDIPTTYLAYVSVVTNKDYSSIISDFGGGSWSFSNGSPDVVNPTQYFIDPNNIAYIPYPETLNIAPVVNNGYWDFKP